MAVRPATSCTVDGPYNGEDRAAKVSNLPPSFFNLPPDADRRLERFLREYHVSTSAREAAGQPLIDGPVAPVTLKKIGVGAAEEASSKPRWMLVHTMEADDY